ncbi:MAG: RNA polymerase sigma factor [Planctomycetota bacterium]
MRTVRREMERVYDQYGSQLFTFALAVTRRPDLAEDAMHEAFCRGLRLTEAPRNVKAYMFRSVRNAAIDQLRRKGRTRSLSEDYIFDSSAGPMELAQQNQFRHRVAAALLKLAEDERETIVQHLYTDLTFQEIADLRERPLGTITSWYRRGLAKLKEHLEA